jgi:hypothetical protein
MAKILRLRSTFARAVNATQYAAGDEVSNHVTAGSVVRATWDMRGLEQGKILAAEMDLTEGSGGNPVTTASDFELLVFRTSEAPAAVGDNVTHPIAAATRALAVARFRFDDTGWTGPLGTVAAGTSQVQAVMPTLVQPLATNVLEYPVYAFSYNFDGTPLTATGRSFTCVLRALAAWNPLGVILTFGITLDIEVP